MSTALIIPTLGAGSLSACLESAARLDPAPDQTFVVLSGSRNPKILDFDVTFLCSERRLGFAAAANAGIAAAWDTADMIALLNDDASPGPAWFGHLRRALDKDSGMAAVQSTVTDAAGRIVDGRGITFDPWGLPIQIDRGHEIGEDTGNHSVAAVSGTACVFRTEALRKVALAGQSVFDPAFGSYHEDVDLGLRLTRLGWRSAWFGGATVGHLGSATGPSFSWRHPWWVLANRWRAISGNLNPKALVKSLPRLLRGEIRAVNTLSRSNWRAPFVAPAVAVSIKALVLSGWLRSSPGPRLDALPEDVQ